MQQRPTECSFTMGKYNTWHHLLFLTFSVPSSFSRYPYLFLAHFALLSPCLWPTWPATCWGQATWARWCSWGFRSSSSNMISNEHKNPTIFVKQRLYKSQKQASNCYLCYTHESVGPKVGFPLPLSKRAAAKRRGPNCVTLRNFKTELNCSLSPFPLQISAYILLSDDIGNTLTDTVIFAVLLTRSETSATQSTE